MYQHWNQLVKFNIHTHVHTKHIGTFIGIVLNTWIIFRRLNICGIDFLFCFFSISILFNFLFYSIVATSLFTQSHPILSYLSIHCHFQYNSVTSVLFYIESESESQLCPTLWDPMDYTFHGILKVRILECVAFPFSRGSSQPRDQTQASHIAGGFFTSWGTREAQEYGVSSLSLLQGINWGLLNCRWILYQLIYQESPFYTEPTAK